MAANNSCGECTKPSFKFTNLNLSNSLMGAIILGVAYGLHVQPKNDPDIEAANKMMDVLTHALLPGAFLVVSPACSGCTLFKLTVALNFFLLTPP